MTHRLSANLTLSENSRPILVGKVRIGAIIRNAAGLHVAWTTKGRVGEFGTSDEAERAVHAARRAEKK